MTYSSGAMVSSGQLVTIAVYLVETGTSNTAYIYYIIDDNTYITVARLNSGF